MGDYTAVHFRLKLKNPVFSQVRRLLECLISGEDFPTVPGVEYTADSAEVFDRIQSMVYGSSVCFDGWHREPRLWLNEDDGYWYFESRGSTKYPKEEDAYRFLNELLPHLEVKKGEILFRSIYEYTTRERVIYFDEGGLVAGDGNWYSGPWDDADHPQQAEQGDEENPIMDYFELTEVVKQKMTAHREVVTFPTFAPAKVPSVPHPKKPSKMQRQLAKKKAQRKARRINRK